MWWSPQVRSDRLSCLGASLCSWFAFWGRWFLQGESVYEECGGEGSLKEWHRQNSVFLFALRLPRLSFFLEWLLSSEHIYTSVIHLHNCMNYNEKRTYIYFLVAWRTVKFIFLSWGLHNNYNLFLNKITPPNFLKNDFKEIKKKSENGVILYGPFI